MKIAFVTGSLEPGRNGVGDYTRSLAAACMRRGHEVSLLSIAERDNAAESIQGVDGLDLPVRRIRIGQWKADEGVTARTWLEQVQPDWVSLQFVPYAFDPRGLFGDSIERLHSTLQGCRLHLFFHEIWIGSCQGAPWKERVIGWCQRRAVRRLLNQLRPAVVQTSNAYYQAALGTLKVKAEILPMFGAVPVNPAGSGNEAIRDLAPDALVCGMFGTLHPGWRSELFLGDFANLALKSARPAALVAAGGLGYGEAEFDLLARKWRGHITCLKLGHQSTGMLSRIFQRFDFAVTSVPWNILGKSSSAAALREHGLEVFVTAAGSPPRFTGTGIHDDSMDESFRPYFRDRGLLSSIPLKRTLSPGVDAIAKRLLEALPR